MIFNIGILFVLVLALRAALTYSFKAKVFPLISIGVAMVLLIVQVVIENRQTRDSAAGVSQEKEKPGTEARILRRDTLAVWAWIGTSALMLWILGFMGTVVFLPFL